MVRTQIQLTEEQAAALRSLSAERNLPMAEIIRISIDAYLGREEGLSREKRVARAASAAGRFSSGFSDVSAEHDAYFAGAIANR